MSRSAARPGRGLPNLARMTRYQVDSEAVAAATAGARTTMTRIEGDAAGLLAQLTGLQNSWTGQAAASFQTAVADWKVTQQRVAESMGIINQALAQAGQTYAEVEAANARLFAR